MKNKYLIAGISSLAVLAAAAGITTQVSAAAPTASQAINYSTHHSMAARTKRPVLTAEQIAARKTEMTAIQTALTNGDYNAWVTAVKAKNPKSPLLTKITAANFSQYVQANNLETQAENIFKTLGVNGGEGRFMGGEGRFMNGHANPLGANSGWHKGQAKPTTK
jgi:hypothetical protein